MTSSQVGKTSVIHPVVIVKVAGYKFRASSTFVKLTKAQPKSSSHRLIAMLMGVTTKMMQDYDVLMQSVTSEFQKWVFKMNNPSIVMNAVCCVDTNRVIKRSVHCRHELESLAFRT